jgi:phage shock protein PspC (stress-responsive transcriptional regulator)
MSANAGAPRLVRPRQNRMIAGVCAGIANRFGWDPTIVRIAAVASILLSGPQIVAYAIAWVLIPNERP